MPPSDRTLGDDFSAIGEDLLKLLANDTRMQILRCIWGEFEFERYVVREQIPIPFSELLERTAIDDSGNLNYHLNQLVGVFLSKRDGGYVLSPLGYNLMRSITTYTSFESQSIEPTELEDPCPFCSGTLAASYDRELVHTYCLDCDGLGSGNINYVTLPAIDVNRRDLGGILDAASIRLLNRTRSVRYGVCGQCYGRLEPSLQICENHEPAPGGACEACGIRFGAEIQVDCDHCGAGGVGPLVELTVVMPQVESFFAAHGPGPRDSGPFRYRLACLETVDETIHATDPANIVYQFTLGSETERVEILKEGDNLTIRPNYHS